MSLPHSTQALRAPLSVRGDDLYETSPCALHALQRVERLPGVIWEPACGPGAIVRELRQAGHFVHATDLVDYGLEDSEHGIDFLLEPAPSFAIGAIVTNPPYKLATEFVRHSLELGIPKIYMLLRLAFLESERRRSILDGGLLARVYPFIERLPQMHRAGWTGPKASSAIPFAWFCWDLGHKGPTELRRISWRVQP